MVSTIKKTIAHYIKGVLHAKAAQITLFYLAYFLSFVCISGRKSVAINRRAKKSRAEQLDGSDG